MKELKYASVSVFTCTYYHVSNIVLYWIHVEKENDKLENRRRLFVASFRDSIPISIASSRAFCVPEDGPFYANTLFRVSHGANKICIRISIDLGIDSLFKWLISFLRLAERGVGRVMIR